MTVRLISYPFRLAANGSVATREDGTEEYYAEELANLVSTRPGERVMVAEYGVEDPTFDDVVAEQIKAKVNTFGPPVSIDGVQTRFVRDGALSVQVSFNPDESTWQNVALVSGGEDTYDELEADLDALA